MDYSLQPFSGADIQVITFSKKNFILADMKPMAKNAKSPTQPTQNIVDRTGNGEPSLLSVVENLFGYVASGYSLKYIMHDKRKLDLPKITYLQCAKFVLMISKNCGLFCLFCILGEEWFKSRTPL